MISRRQLLRGNFDKNAQNEIRPPWAKTEEQFTDLCNRCGDCIKACSEHIIIAGSGRFPTIDFQKGECTFCRQCVEACQNNAFDINQKQPWHMTIDIKDNCLSKIGVICQSCADVCDEHAIKFDLQMGGVPSIKIDVEQCNGCGACIGSCPKNAIVMQAS